MKYLGIMIDNKWSFRDHLNLAAEKASRVAEAVDAQYEGPNRGEMPIVSRDGSLGPFIRCPGIGGQNGRCKGAQDFLVEGATWDGTANDLGLLNGLL